MASRGGKKTVRVSLRLTPEDDQRLSQLADFLGVGKTMALVEALRMMSDTVEATSRLSTQPGIGTRMTTIIEGLLTAPESQDELPGTFLKALRDLDPGGFARRMGAYLGLLLGAKRSGHDQKSG